MLNDLVVILKAVRKVERYIALEVVINMLLVAKTTG